MLVVCSLRAAQDQVTAHGIRRAVSILGPDTPHRRFDGVPHGDHLQLTFNDVAVAMPGMTAPGAAHVLSLIDFVRAWDRGSPMLVHCWAGVSRSTAAAFIAQCVVNPRADEADLALALREISPSATPNRMMVALADAALGREGRMNDAIARIGRGADAFEGGPFIWDV